MAPGDEVDVRLAAMKTDFMKKFGSFYYSPISYQQSKTTVDRPAKGPVWVSKTTFPVLDEDAIWNVILEAIHDLGDDEERAFDKPTVNDVNIQWVGPRPGAEPMDAQPDLGDREIYGKLIEDSPSDSVIYFAHGGLHYQGSPASVRGFTTELSRISGTKCASLNYRLSPQNPFPAALIDAFVGYLGLLYPPADAFHSRIEPENIVFAGESAGGGLLCALLLLIQHIHSKRSGYITFKQKQIHIPFPAGYASLGGHFDFTASYVHTPENIRFDWCTPEPPYLSPDQKPDAIWPSTPPRADIYCEKPMLAHPLISPIASRNLSLLPPLFLAYGEEHLGRQGRLLAQRAYDRGVVVQFHHYQHLMHEFPLLFPSFPPSKHLVKEMGAFIRNCIQRSSVPEKLVSVHVRHPPNDKEVQSVFEALIFCTEDFEKRLEAMKRKRVQRMVYRGIMRGPLL